ncbi:MAG: hypothetical protein HYT94_03650 [Parcubacteria group bacterium]|nr:hypothetical protein [Parcubacteria group bacterium]
MDFGTIGFILGKAGEILIAYTVLSVHNHVRLERKIDTEVVEYMAKERTAGIAGIVLIVAGFLIELSVKLTVI